MGGLSQMTRKSPNRRGALDVSRSKASVSATSGTSAMSRREQFADQIGALAEAPRLDGSRGGECGFDLGEHPWQRDGEREERAVKVGGGHLRFL